eukprot:119814_1
MGLFSFIGWIIGLIFNFLFERINDIFVWILPSYMTVHVIKEEKVTYYQNYLCFWVILAIILGIEHVTFYLFYYILFYRIIRLLFVIWLQIDYCNNSFNVFSKIRPYISKAHEKKLEEALNAVTNKIDQHGQQIQETAAKQFWGMVQQNYEIIKDALFKGLRTVSDQAVNINDSNSNINSNKKTVDVSEELKQDKEKENKNEKPTVRKKEA